MDHSGLRQQGDPGGPAGHSGHGAAWRCGERRRGAVQAGTDDTDGAQGSVNGGVYTNEFAGIGCRLDEGWVFYTAEQMAELNGALADGTDNADVKAVLADDPSIFDMYAVSTDGLMVMNVVVCILA